jgi:two-component system LytT family sensor kinase
MTSLAAPAQRASRVKPWMFVAAIWLWPAVFNVVSRVFGGLFLDWGTPSTRELLFSFVDWLGYALFTPFIFWAANRWPIVRPHLARRVAIHLGFALFLCLCWALGGKLLDLILISSIEPDKLLAAISAAGNDLERMIAMNVLGWIIGALPYGVFVYMTGSAMAHAFGYFTEAREREVQLARISEQLTSARFAALQAQLNPHFMFNTLNTITVLVRDGDRAGAVRIIEHLSELLRRTLSRHKASEVTLGEELDLVGQYLAIEQARFSDRLRVETNVPDALRAAAVPGFAVQHLVENAIRHGVARKEDAGRVLIAARRDGGALEISVTDDGPGVGSVEPAAGHGLMNTRERLRALHGDAASLEVAGAPGGGTMATLRVPYREVAIEATNANG